MLIQNYIDSLLKTVPESIPDARQISWLQQQHFDLHRYAWLLASKWSPLCFIPPICTSCIHITYIHVHACIHSHIHTCACAYVVTATVELVFLWPNHNCEIVYFQEDQIILHVLYKNNTHSIHSFSESETLKIEIKNWELKIDNLI